MYLFVWFMKNKKQELFLVALDYYGGGYRHCIKYYYYFNFFLLIYSSDTMKFRTAGHRTIFIGYHNIKHIKYNVLSSTFYSQNKIKF